MNKTFEVVLATCLIGLCFILALILGFIVMGLYGQLTGSNDLFDSCATTITVMR